MSKRKKGSSHRGAHKYRRIRWKSRQESGEPYYIFRCQIDGCPTFKSRDMVVGDLCVCWRCGKDFQMVYASTYMAKPHCAKCTKSKGPISVDAVMSNLERLLEGD